MRGIHFIHDHVNVITKKRQGERDIVFHNCRYFSIFAASERVAEGQAEIQTGS
jgi:hypothetical protein